jgi:hypothetical protein
MFETLDRLGTEIDGVVSVATASSNKKLQTDVHQFVVDEVDKAFSDVHQLLGEVAFLKPSELTESDGAKSSSRRHVLQGQVQDSSEDM